MTRALPLVTIGIPTFNRAELLNLAIRSALDQTYSHLEVVVSDNCSTDDTQERCSTIARADPRLRYLRHDKNLGATANFQAVLEEARGEYFMWLADDDWIDPNYVAVCEGFLSNDANLQLVSGVASYHRQGKPLFSGETFRLLGSEPRRRVLAYYRTVSHNGVFYGLARTAVLRSLRPLRSRFGEDWLLVASLAVRGGVLTVPTTTIHRSLDGVSSDLRSLAPRWAAASPALSFVALGIEALREATTGPSYAPLSFASRVALGVRALYIMVRRFSVPLVLRSARLIVFDALRRMIPDGAFHQVDARYRRWRLFRVESSGSRAIRHARKAKRERDPAREDRVEADPGEPCG